MFLVQNAFGTCSAVPCTEPAECKKMVRNNQKETIWTSCYSCSCCRNKNSRQVKLSSTTLTWMLWVWHIHPAEGFVFILSFWMISIKFLRLTLKWHSLKPTQTLPYYAYKALGYRSHMCKKNKMQTAWFIQVPPCCFMACDIPIVTSPLWQPPSKGRALRMGYSVWQHTFCSLLRDLSKRAVGAYKREQNA